MYQRKLFDIRYIFHRILSGHTSHWTPRYIFDRIMLEVDYKAHPDSPWLVRAAVLLVEQLLRSEDVGFEWGSGRSTVWFAKRTRKLVSIENDEKWYRRVGQMLERHSLENVDYYLHQTANAGEGLARDSMYVQAISQVGDDSLDYVLVDGSARQWCCLAALPKLKVGGLLILDNANWYITPPKFRAPGTYTEGTLDKTWEEFWSKVSGWRKVWTDNGIANTLLLIKQQSGS